MKLTELRQKLEDYSAPGAALPIRSEWVGLKANWESIRHTTYEEFWPVIDDRISLVESRIRRGN
jgi:hypothetical protein